MCLRVNDGMASDVGNWEPPAALGEAHAAALGRAAEAIDGDALTVDGGDAALIRQAMAAAAPDWERLVDGAPSADLVGWLRVMVLAESQLGVEGGAKSPAILCARALRGRGDYPGELTAWIRSVSDNRFLPYGSLLDRL